MIKRGSDPEQAAAAATHLVEQMDLHFNGAMVNGWEGLEGTYGLPDIDDEHVVAAAVVGGAGAIVTDNHKHFPLALLPNGMQVLHAAEFAPTTRCPWHPKPPSLPWARALDGIDGLRAGSRSYWIS